MNNRIEPLSMIWRGTPNDTPRGDYPIEVVVLHATEGAVQGAVSWLTNPESKVSCHYVISKAGTLYKLASDSMRTWHAGASRWKNPRTGVRRNDVNNVSIGVEMEHLDGVDSWEDEQVKVCAHLYAFLRQVHPSIVAAVSHHEIAVPLGRKVDPLNFPWDKFSDFYKKLV